MSETVYIVQVNVTRETLESFLPHLNDIIETEYESGRDDPNFNPITIEELIGNQRMLKYVCEQAVEDGVAMYDPHTFWNNDGWCDIADYR